ncbi:hypothetical protein [uncultured Chitinophaga sp.]|uniref:hypothetical protein n=1 Tax=uncultured Chitinophaga sp. TaxID=339340 RepID=UPI0025E6BDF1|nr:hypothetical protein [uncultured Chitinophaga sp.]
MQLSYKILFAIEILHDYFASGRCEDFEIVPSPETAQLFRDQQVIWKNLGNKGYALVRVVNGKPLSAPAATDVYRCYLKLKKPLFANYTNLEGAYGPLSRLYFNNLHQLKINNTHYLSAPIAGYNSGSTYLPGALASNGNNVSEALRNSNSGNAHPLNDAVYWRDRGAKRYVTGNDLITHVGAAYTFTLPAPAEAVLTEVFAFNTATGIYDKPALPAEMSNYDAPVTTQAVKIEGLEPGKYRITANGAEVLLYIDGRLRREQVFGVVEIFNHLAGNNDFALLNNNGELKEKVFTIHFANRSAIWKYVPGAGSTVTAIKDSQNNYEFAQNSNVFLSNKPIPLSETPIKSIFLETSNMGPPVLNIRNASAERIKTIERDGDIFYCSEIHLNY